MTQDENSDTTEFSRGNRAHSEKALCVSEYQVEHRLGRIVSSMALEHHACYVIGMGGVTKDAYIALEKLRDVEVLRFGSVLPGGFRVFAHFVASYGGLIKILDPKALYDVFPPLIDQSMAGIYYFPKEYEESFISAAAFEARVDDLDYGLKKYDDYFFYAVDGDNAESATGIVEIISYGTKSSYKDIIVI